MAHKLIDVIGSGKLAQPLTSLELRRHENGFTHPNLHQIIELNVVTAPEIKPRKYHIMIQGLYLMRTTTKCYYDDNNNPDELP